MNLPPKGCLLTVSTFHRNIHLFFTRTLFPSYSILESLKPKSQEHEVLVLGLSLHEGKMGKIMAAAFYFFIKYQQFSYYTNAWYCNFLLMLQLLLLIKIMNTFLAKICTSFLPF